MITYPHPDDYLFYEGKTFSVEWYYTAAGRLPAYDYFLGMDETDQERLRGAVAYIADRPIGTILPRTIYRLEDAADKIYAFKPRDERFFNFMTAGRRIIITNAYRKHSRKMGRIDREDLAVAIRYRADYIRRRQEGTYYENEA
jgi:hypothetical protein